MTADAMWSQLDRLIGTWHSKGRVVGGADAGTQWTGHDIYEWFPGRRHLVHRVDVFMAGARREAIEIFTPREGFDAFDQVSYDTSGLVERAIGSFDDAGRYINDAGEARATVTFHDTDRMSALWELRAADGTWFDWMTIDFTRIAEPHIEVRSKDDHTR